MRISDWSSDVCSSDLVALADDFLHRLHLREAHVAGAQATAEVDAAAEADHQLRDEEGDDRQGHEQPHRADVEIGRASCRERVLQYVYISVVAVSLQQKPTI